MSESTQTTSSSNNGGRYAVTILAIGLALYLTSYIGLRCTVLKVSAKRVTRDGVTRTTSWCYYGFGDNWQTVWSNRFYYPLLRGEHLLFPPAVFE